MSVENFGEEYLKQLAEKCLTITPDPRGHPLCSKLSLKLPLFLPLSGEQTDPGSENAGFHTGIFYEPFARHLVDHFMAATYSEGEITNQGPATAEQIKLLLDVAKRSDKINPDFLSVLRNTAGLRLFEMQQEIERIRKEI